MKRTKKPVKLSQQIKDKIAKQSTTPPTEYDGDVGTVISTGSTLLDLAISGGRVEGGGMPAGILVEIFGPASSGKTVLLSELAGAVQRQDGEVMFHDPEARLNKQFAKMFGLDTEDMSYHTPDRVPEVFSAVRKWEPDDDKVINGVFADSLAALSTDLEMSEEDGDKMGMRRAKEFSEQLRKTCRTLAQKSYLMVCSNQVRQTTAQFGPKYKSPGGEALGFYSSLRLRLSNPTKLKETQRVKGKEVKRVVGVSTEIEVYKSSVWRPYRTAPVTILFDYGVDDIRENLKFVKKYSKHHVYTVGSVKLDKSLKDSIATVEERGLEEKLRRQVIRTWNHIESKFSSNRKTKKR